jgi:hypothetical protein
MKPAARRRVEREIREIMREDGEHCSICRSPLQHNSKTYGGVLKAGDSVLTGECCKGRITEMVLEGLYLDGTIDDLVPRLPTQSGKGTGSGAAPEEAVKALSALFDQRQADGQAIIRRAGLPPGRAKLFTQGTAWKADDAAWFDAHPDRSHRLRELIGDEAAVSGFRMEQQMPERHEMQVLVRQIEPGKRARLPFGRNLDVPIPDDETVLHALFDIVGDPDAGGSVISMDKMRAAIARYEPGTGRPS